MYFYVDVLSFLELNPSVTVRVGVKVPSSRFSLMFCRRSSRRVTKLPIFVALMFYEKGLILHTNQTEYFANI